MVYRLQLMELLKNKKGLILINISESIRREDLKKFLFEKSKKAKIIWLEAEDVRQAQNELIRIFNCPNYLTREEQFRILKKRISQEKQKVVIVIKGVEHFRKGKWTGIFLERIRKLPAVIILINQGPQKKELIKEIQKYADYQILDPKTEKETKPKSKEEKKRKLPLPKYLKPLIERLH